MNVGTDDRIAIHELIALYGHIIDQRAYERLSELFVDDAVFDSTDFGHPVVTGIVRIAEFWHSLEERHPVAHHSTNVVVSVTPDGEVGVVSKGFGVGPNGRVGSGTYHDVVAKTIAGWRIVRRTAVLQRPRTIHPSLQEDPT